MATSGTWAFNLDLPQIIEQAYERIGSELRSGYNYRSARTSLDLLMLEWQNRGLNLWAVKNASQILTAGTGEYALSSEKLDVIEGSIRTGTGTSSQQDISIPRISISDWAQNPSKLQTGRPSQFTVIQSPDAITVSVWPVPDATTTYVFNYWYMERIEDTGNDGTNTVDVPSRFLPALIAGLAYQLALKDPNAIQLIQKLEQEYEKQFELAADSARDKAAVHLVPGGYS